MGDEEYYFEEDYQDNDMEVDEEEAWKVEVENNYATAKGMIDSKPTQAVQMLEGVIRDDQEKGKWTFKALKAIVKAYNRSRQYDLAIAPYRRLLAFEWKERTRTDVEKAVNKILDQAAHAEPHILRELYSISVEAIEKDLRNFEKLWFSLRMKNAQIIFETRDFKLLEKELKVLRSWCTEGENAEQRRGTQLLSVLALEIQLHTELGDTKVLRDLYNQANSVKYAIPSPKVMGIIRECGGKMFMRQSQWTEAYEAFFQAFRHFDEAGQLRKIQCLKYLVLATMLSGSKINPFDTNEARSYQRDPEIVAMTELIDACNHNDIRGFEKVLKGNAKSIMTDPFLYSYLEPLVRKVRCQVLIKLIKPYTTITISHISKELNVSNDDVEALLTTLILDQKVDARIDQVRGVVVVRSNTDASERRLGLLEEWIESNKVVVEALALRVCN